MSDEKKPLSFAPEATEKPSEQIVQETQTEAKPEYVTREVLEQRLSEVERRFQSLTDKGQARIMAQLDRLKNAGISATPEQVEKLIREEEKSKGPANSPVTPAKPTQGETANDPVLEDAYRILRDAGIDPNTVNMEDSNDPDIGLIDTKTKSPYQFLQSVQAYAKARSERPSRQSNPARTPGFTGAPNGAGVDTLTSELQTLLKDPIRNMERIKELRRKLQG